MNEPNITIVHGNFTPNAQIAADYQAMLRKYGQAALLAPAPEKRNGVPVLRLKRKEVTFEVVE